MRNIFFKLFYKAFKMKALIEVCKDYDKDELLFFKDAFDKIDKEKDKYKNNYLISLHDKHKF